ncbi:MAG TPA: tyrosine-type recombinase/integrase [Candidatus Saccharimonadia bacterium]|nr:tyrosine-type recombinase/integrase [Candidatus Saccharimonadia bacterium]
MNRPRVKDRDLPKCMYRKHGAFWYVKGGKWTRLGTVYKTALNAYAERVSAPTGGMAQLIDDAIEYIKPGLSKATYDQYTGAAKKLKKVFAEFAPEQVRQKHVMKFKVSFRKTPNMTNRCLSVLRQVFDYALEIEYPGLDTNPAIGVKRLAEKKRDRLISWAEYEAIYAASGPRLQVITDLLIRTGQRITAVLRIKRANILEEGIRFGRHKTDTKGIVTWTPELREVIERAKRLNGNIAALTLLCGRRGKAPDYRTVKDQWDKACKAAGVEDAHLHDLRALAATEAKKQGKNPTALLQHSSPQQTQRYLRGKEEPLVDGPSFRQLKDTAKNGD